MRDYSRQFCALEWAEYVGRTECAHMIAHFMLKISSKNLFNTNNNNNNSKRNSEKKRYGTAKNNLQLNYKFKYSSTATIGSTIIFPSIKKMSDSACNNFKKVFFIN